MQRVLGPALFQELTELLHKCAYMFAGDREAHFQCHLAGVRMSSAVATGDEVLGQNNGNPDGSASSVWLNAELEIFGSSKHDLSFPTLFERLQFIDEG